MTDKNAATIALELATAEVDAMDLTARNVHVALTKDNGYVLMKNDLFYRPNSQGYTGIREEAGLYYPEEAAKHVNVTDGEVSMMPWVSAPEYSAACYSDLKDKHMEETIKTLRIKDRTAQVELKRLRHELQDLTGATDVIGVLQRQLNEARAFIGGLLKNGKDLKVMHGQFTRCPDCDGDDWRACVNNACCQRVDD